MRSVDSLVVWVTGLRPAGPRRILPIVLGVLVIAAPAENALAQMDYVGSEACVACHQESTHAYEQTVHARVLNEVNARSVRAARGCEACHGPGLSHVQGEGRGDADPAWIAFGSRDSAEIRRENDVCLSCHAESRIRLWSGSPHASKDVGYATCHDIKKPASTRHLLAAADQTGGRRFPDLGIARLFG